MKKTIWNIDAPINDKFQNNGWIDLADKNNEWLRMKSQVFSKPTSKQKLDMCSHVEWCICIKTICRTLFILFCYLHNLHSRKVCFNNFCLVSKTRLHWKVHFSQKNKIIKEKDENWSSQKIEFESLSSLVFQKVMIGIEQVIEDFLLIFFLILAELRIIYFRHIFVITHHCASLMDWM